MEKLRDDSGPRIVSIAGGVSKSEAQFVQRDMEMAAAAAVDFEREKSYVNVAEDALGKNQQLLLTWDGIVTEVSVKKDKKMTKKRILDHISGAAQPGQVLAIMGPSGGGKTSLLNVLAGRSKVNEGTVLLNAHKLPGDFNKVSAYVMQDDLLFGTLTPREILTFAANLRLSFMPAAERAKRVEYLLKILSLGSCANTRVGRPQQRGISGGERKRTAIGYEMVTNPSLMFLDEPTTGLDSFTAMSVIKLLRKLALQGRTVICTIHQPSSEIFALFDRLLLLSQGKVAYSGPAQVAVRYFGAIGYQCPTYSNPSDYYMKILKTRDETDTARVDEITNTWQTKGADTVKQLVGTVVEEATVDASTLTEVQHANRTASSLTEIYWLTWRSTVDTYRNPLTFYARLAQFVIVGIFLGATYIPIGNDQSSIKNYIGSLFFITIGMVMLNANAIILTFPLERALLVRDQFSGMYRVWTYYLGKMISELPFGIIVAIFASVAPYWFIGYANTAQQFFTFLFAVWVQMYVGGSIGLLIGCAMPNPELAVSLSPVFIIPFMLFGGFYANTGSIGPWLNWVQWISPFKWGFEAFGINQFTDQVFTCTDSQFIHYAGQTICPVTSGNQLITALNYWSPNVWTPIGILLGIAFAFRVIALIALEAQTAKALRRT